MLCVPDGYLEPDRKAVNEGTQELEKGCKSCLHEATLPLD